MADLGVRDGDGDAAGDGAGGSGISLALRGRLEPDELAFLWHIRSRLQVGKPIQLLAFSLLIFFVGGLGLALYLASMVHHVLPGGQIVGLILALTALFDVSGLTLVRHRIMVRLLRRPRPETAVQLDDEGIRYAPVGQEASHTSFGWPLLDVLALSEGIVIALRQAAVPIVFFPKRALSAADSQRVLALAHARGARANRQMVFPERGRLTD